MLLPYWTTVSNGTCVESWKAAVIREWKRKRQDGKVQLWIINLI